MKKYSYDIRQIDAWAEDVTDDGAIIWTWNDSYHVDTWSTSAQDHKKAFIEYIHKRNPGLNFKRSGLYVDYDGSVFELRHKSDDEPILAAIPNF